MATLDVTLFSQTLNLYTHVTVLLPEARHRMEEAHPDKKYPVIYCLHGYTDNYQSWLRKSTLEIEAKNHDCVIVMPDCPNSFYANGKTGMKYYDYVTEELPVKMANFFPVDTDPEKTFIMGASMGGYGAFLLALRNPDKYAAAVSFSGAFDFMNQALTSDGHGAVMSEHVFGVFGSSEEYYGSESDLYHVVEQLDKSEGKKPRLLAVCGSDDPLCYGFNEDFAEFMKDKSFDFTYKTSPGVHDYFFWNQYIGEAFRFFGL